MGAITAPLPGTVPDRLDQNNIIGGQMVPATVEQIGKRTPNWLLGRGQFEDKHNTVDTWRISVPDTSSEEDTVSDEGDNAMDPMGDGARNSLRNDEDDVVIPGTPEPSIGRRMKRSLPSTGKPSKLNFVDVSVPGPSDNSPPTPDADIIFDNDDRSEAGVGDRIVIPEILSICEGWALLVTWTRVC